MEQIHFITFGSQRFYNSVNRICNEAKEFNLFDKIIGYTEKDLWNSEFIKHCEFVSRNHRGFGYWLWKSFLVSKYLETMNEGDILFYADSGCQLKVSGIKRMKEYLEIVRNSPKGILGFQMEHLEKTWTKMDLFHYLQAEDLKETGQLVGGIFFIKKCDFVVNLIKKWYETCCNYYLIDDSPSFAPNNETFREHRHDQSVFSLLRKKYGCEILEDETYTGPNWDLNMPIWATRTS